MVSTTTRYGLSIVGHLVDHLERWSPVKEIADETGVPANYLSKILSRLAREGLVDSLKGWGGGFRLRPEALERPIQDIIVMLEGRAAGGPQPCIFGFPQCDAAVPCPLHDQWKEVRESYERMMRETTIASLRSTNGRAARLRALPASPSRNPSTASKRPARRPRRSS